MLFIMEKLQIVECIETGAILPSKLYSFKMTAAGFSGGFINP